MAEKGFFDEIHRELEAKMVPRGKWSLPLFYPGGSIAEHRHTLNGASIFDMSWNRCFQISGKEVLKKIDALVLYSCESLAVGKAMDNLLLREDGTVGVMFTLCRMQENDLFMMLDHNTSVRDAEFLIKLFSAAAEVVELSQAMAMLTVAGKKCREVLSAAGAENILANGFQQMITLKDDEDDEFRCIAIGHDRLGTEAVDLCFNGENAAEVYGALYRIAGAEPAGIGAWESLRIENGIPGFDTDIRPDMYPQECGFPAVDMTREFYGKAALQQASFSRRIIILDLERHPALPGTVVKLPGNIAAGVVSSGAFCPGRGVARAVCITDIDSPAAVGTVMECVVNGKVVGGKISAIAALEMMKPGM